MNAATAKKYYNSITRQSGIVHKDKAMRQLDLFLLQWLVAGSEGSNHSNLASLLLIWFDCRQRMFWRNEIAGIKLQQINNSNLSQIENGTATS